ncbi:putative transposase [Neisseria gonorrhoeae]|uniref:Putative transposase n=1 Tax=Neisseria gonorrhoeae TaxID=485 RepID=A0A378VW93_NEIGO|nr:putative transposase [Neisseria gonorrhoeae]
MAEQIKGIGSITTATLMAMLPELGRLSHKRIAGLVGIAPHPRESGETKFKAAASAEGLRCVRRCIWLPRQRHVLNRLFGISTNACCIAN